MNASGAEPTEEVLQDCEQLVMSFPLHGEKAPSAIGVLASKSPDRAIQLIEHLQREHSETSHAARVMALMSVAVHTTRLDSSTRQFGLAEALCNSVAPATLRKRASINGDRHTAQRVAVIVLAGSPEVFRAVFLCDRPPLLNLFEGLGQRDDGPALLDRAVDLGMSVEVVANVLVQNAIVNPAEDSIRNLIEGLPQSRHIALRAAAIRVIETLLPVEKLEKYIDLHDREWIRDQLPRLRVNTAMSGSAQMPTFAAP